jgi:chemotaxis methyl-accepting protein methylase
MRLSDPAWSSVLKLAMSERGDHGRTHLANLTVREPDMTPAQAEALYRRAPTSTQTHMFREANLEVFARHVAPTVVAELGHGALRIGQIAASTGREALSLAGLLRIQRVPFTIHGFDVNPDTVAQANSPTLTADEINDDTSRLRLKPFIEPAGRRKWTTNDHYRSLAQFSEHDILRNGPLPNGPYDAIFANNILYHYQGDARDQITSNLVDSLNPGGAFVFEGNTYRMEYKVWSANLTTAYGLAEVPSAGDLSYQIRQLQASPPSE